MWGNHDHGRHDATYTYDADKRRVAKTVDSTTIKYFLDGPNVIADYDGDDVLLATYVTPGLDANLSQERDGSTYYYMADGLGSIRNLVDANEDTQNTYDYYAFGKELGSWTQNVTNRYTYTAREYDTESEQYYYRARYYSGNGRFLSRDPALPFDYIYVTNAPVSRVDPSGLWGNDIHYDLTYQLAAKAGIACPGDIAAGALRPDLDYRRAGFEGVWDAIKHALAGDFDSYQEKMELMAEWHFPQLANGLVLPNSEIARQKAEWGLARCNLKDFSEGLHVLQDSWAHQGVPYTFNAFDWLPGVGHWRGGYWDDKYVPGDDIYLGTFWVNVSGTQQAALSTSADDAYLWQADVRKTGLRTYELLVKFVEQCPCACPGSLTKKRAAEPEGVVARWLHEKYPKENVKAGDSGR